MIKLILKIFIIFYFLQLTEVNSNEKIFIVYKINEEIITNIDIEKEKRYLLALNKQLQNLDEQKIIEIAKDSQKKEVIKKIELKKYFELDQKNPILEKVIENFYLKLDLKNSEEFEKYLSKYNLTTNYVKKKIELEVTWNQLIYDKYQNQIDINEEKILKRIKNDKLKKNTKQYLISEILFELTQGEKLEEKTDQINKSINKIGFKNTANSFSISDTAKFGGFIGWINERSFNQKLINAINNLQVGQHSKPVQISNGFLILKIDNIKNENLEINTSKLLEKMIQFEKNKQLERFSIIYYDKVKINLDISEK
jgi:peptidyl-prolyl cis-trans isomerase SurA